MFGNVLRKQSFLRQIESSRLDHIVLVRGKGGEGQPVWYYVMLHPGKLKAFRAHQAAAQVKLSDYGRILHSGYGCEPSPLASWQMKQRYGFVS